MITNQKEGQVKSISNHDEKGTSFLLMLSLVMKKEGATFFLILSHCDRGRSKISSTLSYLE
jgi:hypothetical protein